MGSALSVLHRQLVSIGRTEYCLIASLPREKVEADWARVGPRVGSRGGREEKQDRCGLQHHLSHVSLRMMATISI